MGNELQNGFRVWMEKNKDRLPHYAFFTLAAAAALFLAGALSAAVHPASGEIISNTLIRACTFITISLFACAAMLAIAAFAYNFGKGWQVEFSKPAGLLPASNYQEPDIAPDVLISLRPGEDRVGFVGRMERAITEAGNGVWVVVVPYRYPSGMIYESPTRFRDFLRDAPPFQSPDWADEQKVCPPATYFRDENPAEYRAYLQRFAFYFREWSARVKVSGEDVPSRRLEILYAGIRHCLNALVFAALSLPCFAQKAQQVEAALGTRIREIPKAETRVEYEFESTQLYRTGDGRRDYVALLKSLPGYRDGGGGKFIALRAGGRVVCRGESVQEVAARDEMRPNRASVARTDEPVNYSLPDSLSMAEAANRAKFEVWRATEAIGQGVEPWWGVVMYTLWRVFPFLILAGGVSWLFAGVCAREGMFTLHKHARRIFAILALSVAAVLLVNFLLAAVAMGLGPVGLSLVAAAETGAAYWLVTWLIPDFRPAAGNHPREGGYYNDNNPRLLG